jgi:hypothetical protein
MSTQVSTRIVVRQLWIVAALAMSVLYATNPLWPHAAAYFPWRWWAASLFLVAAGVLCRLASKFGGNGVRLLLLTSLLIFYLFAEGFAFIAVYSALYATRSFGIVGYLFTGFINLLSQMLVVLIFAVFCTVQFFGARFQSKQAQPG